MAGILRIAFLDANALKQASLPIRFGGIGITQTVPLVGPNFFSSYALMTTFIACILWHDSNRYSPPHVVDITTTHSLCTGSLICDDDLRNTCKLHKRLMDKHHELIAKSLLASGILCDQACFRVLSLSHANDWLYALSISMLDQRVQSRPFWIMIQGNLGISVQVQLSKCPLCA